MVVGFGFKVFSTRTRLPENKPYKTFGLFLQLTKKSSLNPTLTASRLHLHFTHSRQPRPALIALNSSSLSQSTSQSHIPSLTLTLSLRRRRKGVTLFVVSCSLNTLIVVAQIPLNQIILLGQSKCICMDGFELRNAEQWRRGNWCLQNCSCNAFVVTSYIGCMTWSSELIDLRSFEKAGISLYIRLADSEFVYAFADHSVPADFSIDSSEVNAPNLPVFNFNVADAATDNFSEENKLWGGLFVVDEIRIFLLMFTFINGIYVFNYDKVWSELVQLCFFIIYEFINVVL